MVLILVLVEDGLGDSSQLPKDVKKRNVLILVLVEDGLGEATAITFKGKVVPS